MYKESNGKVAEVKIRNLIKYLLRHVKVILVIMCVGAICATFGNYYIARKNWQNNEQEIAEPEQETEETELTEEELQEVAIVEQMEEKNELQKTYIEESLLMELDPYEKWSMSVQYEILRNPEKGAMLVTYIESDEFIGQLEEITGIEEEKRYLKEVITVEQDEDSVIITYAYPAQKDVADAIDQLVQTYCVEQLHMESSDIQLVDVFINTTVDSDLVGRQINVLNNYNIMKNIIINQKSGLNEKQKKYLEREEKVEEEEEEPEPEADIDAPPTIDMKWAIAGAVAALAGCLLIFTLKYISMETIYDVSDVRELWNVPALGKVIANTGTREGKREAEIQAGMLAINLSECCSRENIQEIFVINLAKGEACDLLEKSLAGLEITKRYVNEKEFSPILLQEILKQKRIILMIEEEQTRVREVDNILSICEFHNIEVLGMIVVGM